MKHKLLIFVLFMSASRLGAFSGMTTDGLYLPVGLNLSYAKGFAIGGEVSLAFMKEGFWYGLYIDGVYNNEKSYARYSAGPEFGVLFLGLDAGMTITADAENSAKLGVTARLLLSFAVAHPYLRIEHRFKDETLLEFGILFKTGPFFKLD